MSPKTLALAFFQTLFTQNLIKLYTYYLLWNPVMSPYLNQIWQPLMSRLHLHGIGQMCTVFSVYSCPVRFKNYVWFHTNIVVTECICTLCLCSCMYLGYVALSVFFRVCTSVNLLHMCCDLDVTMRRHKKRRAREGEREEQWPLACTIQKKRRNKIRNLWLWLFCCSLLPACNFHHRPFT